MADAELHIIIKSAGDPEKLGALLNAVMALKEQERPIKTVVPVGYRCCECWREDGSHDTSCSMRTAQLLGNARPHEAAPVPALEISEPMP